MTDSDPDLLRRTAAGDHDAFEQLVRRHQAAVFRLVRAASLTRPDAEDAFQEAFLAAYRSAASYRGEAAVRTWLFTIARHAAWRIREARGRQSDTDPIDERDEAAMWELGLRAGWGEDPERRSMQAESAAVLRRALETLGPHDREILVLRELEELTGEEVADVLGLTAAAMKSRLHRARLRLAAVLRQGGRDGA